MQTKTVTPTQLNQTRSDEKQHQPTNTSEYALNYKPKQTNVAVSNSPIKTQKHKQTQINKWMNRIGT